MTREEREETIRQLNDLMEHCDNMARGESEALWSKDVKALNAAIQTLEQEPCEDAISRGEVLDEINNIGVRAFADYNSYSELFDFVDTLPPVIPARAEELLSRGDKAE